MYLYSMDPYLVALATGAIGLAAMAIGGMSHGSHGGHGHGDAGHAGGHAGGHSLGHGHGHGHAVDAHGSHSSHPGDGSHGINWMSFLSPRLLFALLVGFGAGGIAATPLGEPFRFAAAVLTSAGFEAFLVGPLWRFMFRFESKAALTLESAIEDEAKAVTGFDRSGCGLVAVDVDGQVVQLLATLSAEERARGTRVHSGDTVRIAEVDAARGRCTVTLPLP